MAFADQLTQSLRAYDAQLQEVHVQSVGPRRNKKAELPMQPYSIPRLTVLVVESSVLQLQIHCPEALFISKQRSRQHAQTGDHALQPCFIRDDTLPIFLYCHQKSFYGFIYTNSKTDTSTKMSVDYASRLSEYENKGKCGQPEVLHII